VNQQRTRRPAAKPVGKRELRLSVLRLTVIGMEPLEDMQLGLFGEVVPAGTGTRSRQRTNAPATQIGGQFQTLKRSNQDALAAVTALFNDGAPIDRESLCQARALVTGQATADLREVALAAAFVAAMCLRYIEKNDPGAGADFLETMGITLAQQGDGPRRRRGG
jgi:hypothetical protein